MKKRFLFAHDALERGLSTKSNNKLFLNTWKMKTYVKKSGKRHPNQQRRRFIIRCRRPLSQVITCDIDRRYHCSIYDTHE